MSLYWGDSGNSVTEDWNITSSESLAMVIGKRQWKVKEELTDALCQLNLPQEGIVHEAVSRLKTIWKVHPCLLKPRRAHQLRGLTAVVLCDCVAFHGGALTPQEAAYVLNTSVADMQEAEREYVRTSIFSPPSSFASRYSGCLGLPSSLRMCVEVATRKLDFLLQKPEIIIAGVLLCLQEEMKKQLQMEYNMMDLPNCICHSVMLPALSKSELALFFNISKGSISNMRNKMTAEVLFIIEHKVRSFVLHSHVVSMQRKIKAKPETIV